MQNPRRELELKLLAPADLQQPKLDDIRGVAAVHDLPLQRLRATYFDTLGLRLLSLGVTLRYRAGEASSRWTLKLPVGNDVAARDEIDFPGKRDRVPQEALDVLLAVRAGEDLVPVASIRTSRHRWSLVNAAGDELAEVVDDRVSVMKDGSAICRFREIEIEARAGSRRLLERAALAFHEAGAEPGQVSKLARALNDGSVTPLAPPAAPAGDPGATVREMIAAHLHRLLVHDPYARMMDVEGIHQVRVAARRIRTMLREFGAVLPPGDLDEISEELRWVGRALGEVRDLDVLAEHLHAEAGDFKDDFGPAFRSLAGRHARARDALREEMSEDRYVQVLARLEALIEAPSRPTAGRLPSLGHLARRSFRRFIASASALTHKSSDAEFHRARIRAKRARYVADAMASLTKSKRKRDYQDFAAVAEQVQNNLGDYRDMLFMRDALAGISARFPDRGALGFRLGGLAEKADQRAADLREEFLQAWPRLSSRRLPRAWRT